MRQMLKECKDASGCFAMWQYLVSSDADFSNTTILESGISSIDTWYLVSPSTIIYAPAGKLAKCMNHIMTSVNYRMLVFSDFQSGSASLSDHEEVDPTLWITAKTTP